jgi:hypothetical protein
MDDEAIVSAPTPLGGIAMLPETLGAPVRRSIASAAVRFDTVPPLT